MNFSVSQEEDGFDLCPYNFVFFFLYYYSFLIGMMQIIYKAEVYFLYRDAFAHYFCLRKIMNNWC